MFLNYLLGLPRGAEWILIIVAFAIVSAFLAFWIYTIVKISKSKFNDDSSKIVWLLVVILTGFVGLLIYWIFGRSSGVVIKEP